MTHWRRHGRHGLPWRPGALKLRQDGTCDPYAILVSEIMLQQTQVDRVVPFFERFIARFPDARTLARARTGTLLAHWQGLGYNRRALMLRRCARQILAVHGGTLPADHAALTGLPGIGPYTAGAVLVFAFDRPYPLVETNIRRAYIHHFFPNGQAVSDADILPLVTDHGARAVSPRVWFSALMDYGSWLAGRVPNPNLRSRHHARQRRFEGSVRQLRGRALKRVLAGGRISVTGLCRHLADERAARVIADLAREGFIRVHRGRIRMG